MKKFILTALVAFASILTATSQHLVALPIDTAVVYGTLPNGLTYIIRHNDTQKNRADFYIAQKVGSILEEDNQSGLAHFLEHMAFNGTENFPDKSLINYLERNGVKFGADLNAYTGFDETVYNIANVPTDKENIVDSCIYILRDWACGISLMDSEIDNERGVIQEEWRTRNNPQMRQLEKKLPILMKDSKYAQRLPIGSMDVVMNFSYQELKDYYKKWYRPDLQGIIIVGDIDVKSVEQNVIELFGKIELDPNAAERTEFYVPDNETPLAVVATEKEAQYSTITLFNKHDVFPQNLDATILGLIDGYKKDVICIVLNERLSEITQDPSAPFVYAQANDRDLLSKNIDSFTMYAVPKEGEEESTLITMVTESERLVRFGVTEGEYQRAKAKILALYNKLYNERNNTRNSKLVKEYVEYFLNGGSIMGITAEYEAIKQIAEEITIEDINKTISTLIDNSGKIVTLDGIEKEGVTYPTTDRLIEIVNSGETLNIEPYVDTTPQRPLLETEPTSGKIKSTKTNDKIGTTEWRLSNGAKVIVKPTDFKSDEIKFVAISRGGSLLYGQEDAYSVRNFESIIRDSKVGGLTTLEQRKLLAGKHLYAKPYLNENSEAIYGSSTIKDLESLMQLIYLTQTDISKDEDAFNAWNESMKVQIKNQDASPYTAITDTILSALYGDNPLFNRLVMDDLNKVDYNRIIEIWEERFKNAGDYTYIFVGNVDLDTLKPLVERYIASIPTQKSKDKYSSEQVSINRGDYTNNFKNKMDNPKGLVVTYFVGDDKYSAENTIKLSIFDQIMDIIYTKAIREDEGGTYGVRTSTELDPVSGQWVFKLSFETNVESIEHLHSIALNELEKATMAAPDSVIFNKVIEYMIKDCNDRMRENQWWVSYLRDNALYGYIEPELEIEYIKSLTPEDIYNYINEIFKSASKIEITMEGE